MKLHFEPDLDYQLDAIEAVCALFKGQEICRTEFTVSRPALAGLDTESGVGNRLTLLDEEILANLSAVQLCNALPHSEKLEAGDFTVEMETGAERLYFVVETKGSLLSGDLRGIESGKIECGKAHFKALATGENPAHYTVATTLDEVMAGI